VRPAAVLAALVLGAVPAACSGDDGDPAATGATGPPPTTAPASLYDLAPGDCFSGLGTNQDLRVRVVACERPHQAEVYGALDLREGRFPGAEVLRRQAATGCAQRFAGYTGDPAGPDTALGFVEVVPSLASWSAGDRRALCIALGPDDAPQVGSIAAGGPS
jgi:hypothetical protein